MGWVSLSEDGRGIAQPASITAGSAQRQAPVVAPQLRHTQGQPAIDGGAADGAGQAMDAPPPRASAAAGGAPAIVLPGDGGAAAASGRTRGAARELRERNGKVLQISRVSSA